MHVKAQDTKHRRTFSPTPVGHHYEQKYHPYLESWNVTKEVGEFLCIHCC